MGGFMNLALKCHIYLLTFFRLELSDRIIPNCKEASEIYFSYFSVPKKERKRNFYEELAISAIVYPPDNQISLYT